jgi:hypothetical protein
MRLLSLVLTALLGGAASAQENAGGGATMAERQEGETACATLPWQRVPPAKPKAEEEQPDGTTEERNHKKTEDPKPKEVWYRIDYPVQPAGDVPDLLRITLERHGNEATLRFFALVGRKEQRAFGTTKSVATFWTGEDVGPIPETVTPDSLTPSGKVVGIYPRFVLPLDEAKQLSLGPIVRMTLGKDAAISWEIDPKIAADLRKAISCVTGVSSAQDSVVPDAEETSDLDALRPVLEPEP